MTGRRRGRALHRATPPTASGGPLVTIAGAATLALVVAAVAFRLLGGSWFIVETPSMSPAAPVGTLLLERPVQAQDVRVGDVISFRPPTEPKVVYTHRVVRVTHGGFRTRGDLNGADDGWLLPASDVIGRAIAILPGLGWAVRALPIVVAGVLLTLALTRSRGTGFAPGVVRVLGVGLSVALAAAWLHPFASMVLLETSLNGSKAATTVVSTGLLPIRVTAYGGASIVLAPGHAGTLHVDDAAGRHIAVTSALALPAWAWAVLVSVCAAPFGAVLAALVRTSRRIA